MIFKEKYYTGAFIDKIDARDRIYDEVATGADEVDWDKGFDIEKELNIKIPFKSQGQTNSCVGQAWAYYAAVLNAKEVKYYSDVSAKSIYSHINLGGVGGAYIREGGKLLKEWGALLEYLVPSYDNGNLPKESFMQDLSWQSPALDKLAKVLAAKEYRMISAASNMDLFAKAIRDNCGVVGGVRGANSSGWSSNEPRIPEKSTWAHCIYYGKFGIDKLGKYIATPNSWGTRNDIDELHLDDWQKLRESYFDSRFQFNPWTLVDKPNIGTPHPNVDSIIKNNEKKYVVEAGGHGRVGIIIGGKLREVMNNRRPQGNTYVITNNQLGTTISTQDFDLLPRGKEF